MLEEAHAISSDGTVIMVDASRNEIVQGFRLVLNYGQKTKAD